METPVNADKVPETILTSRKDELDLDNKNASLNVQPEQRNKSKVKSNKPHSLKSQVQQHTDEILRKAIQSGEFSQIVGELGHFAEHQFFSFNSGNLVFYTNARGVHRIQLHCANFLEYTLGVWNFSNISFLLRQT